MALSTLFNGTDCGPINPLRSLTKQFDTNRGVQQDFFGAGNAGSSQQVFRIRSPQDSAVKEATRFFAAAEDQTSHSHLLHPTPFNPLDLDALRTNLPKVDNLAKPFPFQSNIAGDSSWSNDFLKQRMQQHAQNAELHYNPQASQVQPRNMQIPQFLPALGSRQHLNTGNPMYWKDINFPDSEESTIESPSLVPEYATKDTDAVISADADELSHTAGLLIDAVQQETNPKFTNSVFLSLMRQLRDRELTIRGSEIVQIKDSEPIDIKGKGKAKFDITHTLRDVSERNMVGAHVGSSIAVPSSVDIKQLSPDIRTVGDIRQGYEMETDDDRYWREENSAYKQYWSQTQTVSHSETSRHAEWDKLQEDWEKFEATSTGVRPVSSYSFQPHNPYLHSSSSTNDPILRNHTPESCLELEAAVQSDLRDPVRWYRLGVKQQENEREQNAILALQRATELNPSYLEAWLALAISYTNEGDRFGAYDAIRNWLSNHPKYNPDVSLSVDSPGGQKDRELVQQLMLLIRQSSDSEIDADLQTALGVVLNTSESFERAHDCFRTALSVRPNDWLLYNRVGATLANSGRAKDAVWYYHQALSLNPSYIRARFNLGISYINMKQYDDAARHILDALVLQESDTSDGNTRGITSSALWECLRTTCMHLQRTDLAALCDARNLEGFRYTF